jgi:cytochrome b6
MSRSVSGSSLRRWLDERYELTPLVDFLRHKEVPIGAHSMLWYFLGGLTLFFFSVQVATGILLLMYYQPGQTTAYESIHFLTTKVPFGWIIRSIHCWSAHLMIVSLVVHMFSTMLLKAYRSPRELTWVSGYGLFALTLAFGFTGYLLPWNELAYFATVVGTDSVKSVPVVGNWLMHILRGGPDVTINTLYRFFVAHVVILPLLCVGFVTIHLLFIQRQGMAPPLGRAKALRGMRFFPDFAVRDVVLWLLCFALLLALSAAAPYGAGIPGLEWELGNKADPLAPAYPGIKPEWYFLWVYQLLKEFPPHVLGMEGPQACLLIVFLLMGIWAVVPWIDRKAHRGQQSPEFSDLAFAAMFFLLFLTLKAWDIGVDDPNAAEAEGIPARIAAHWTLGFAVIATVIRAAWHEHRWFVLSGAALAQALLHGYGGISYLSAGVIAVVPAALIVGFQLFRRPGSDPAAP